MSLLFFLQASCLGGSASYEENLKQVISSYPVKADSFSDENSSEFKTDSSKDLAFTTWQGKLGKVDVSIDVEKANFLSQCRSEWKKKRKKEEKR